MSSKLFAFQVAQPLEASREEVHTAEYNSQSQTLVWQGNSRAQALYCTKYSSNYGQDKCNAYGDYCTTWEPGIGSGYFYYKCD